MKAWRETENSSPRQWAESLRLFRTSRPFTANVWVHTSKFRNVKGCFGPERDPKLCTDWRSGLTRFKSCGMMRNSSTIRLFVMWLTAEMSMRRRVDVRWMIMDLGHDQLVAFSILQGCSPPWSQQTLELSSVLLFNVLVNSGLQMIAKDITLMLERIMIETHSTSLSKM